MLIRAGDVARIVVVVVLVASDAGVDKIMAASVGGSKRLAAGWLAVLSDCG